MFKVYCSRNHHLLMYSINTSWHVRTDFPADIYRASFTMQRHREVPECPRLSGPLPRSVERQDRRRTWKPSIDPITRPPWPRVVPFRIKGVSPPLDSEPEPDSQFVFSEQTEHEETHYSWIAQSHGTTNIVGYLVENFSLDISSTSSSICCNGQTHRCIIIIISKIFYATRSRTKSSKLRTFCRLIVN